MCDVVNNWVKKVKSHTPAAQAPARGSATRQRWPPRSSAALRSASAARHRSLACSGRYSPRPMHANCNQMLAASPCGLARQSAAGAGRARRRSLCRGAWHRARTWRHNDCRIRMTLADLTSSRSYAPSPVNDATGPAICSSKGPTCEPSSTSLLVRSAAMICRCQRPRRYGAFSRTDGALWRASRRATHRDHSA